MKLVFIPMSPSEVSRDRGPAAAERLPAAAVPDDEPAAGAAPGLHVHGAHAVPGPRLPARLHPH